MESKIYEMLVSIYKDLGYSDQYINSPLSAEDRSTAIRLATEYAQPLHDRIKELEKEKDRYEELFYDYAKEVDELQNERKLLEAKIDGLEAELQTHIGLVDHMKEVCDEYEKELQLKQKAIDALLDPEF